jgi:hypothetical protein
MAGCCGTNKNVALTQKNVKATTSVIKPNANTIVISIK